MIRCLMDCAPGQRHHADVCIVGAGAAGITLAVELVSRGKSVLLLEGGGIDIEEASQDSYKSEIVGLPHNGIHVGRFRAHGGSTTRWGGQILELDEMDFLERHKIEASGWPIPKKELVPHYARAIELEGLSDATLLDEDVWRQIKLSPPEIDSFDVVFSRWCPEPNFARLHAATLKNNPAVTVWLYANAVAMQWESSRVRAITCKTLTGIEATFSGEHFVFCLGGIESSRFFLQPHAAAGPWNRNGLLGRNFQDHIVCAAATLEVTNPAVLHQAFDNVFSHGVKYQPKIHLKSEIQQAEGLLNVAASLSFGSEFDEASGKLKATARRILRGDWKEASSSDLLHAIRHAPLLARQALRYLLHKRAYNPPDATVVLLAHCEQEPASKSSITLSDTRDSLGLFRTKLDWQISDREVKSIRTFVDYAAKSLNSIGRVVADPELMALDPAFKAKCGDSYHHMGGMRMSRSPDEGIVDLDLRLHGMENCYICSSAVFPTSGYSNPTHTVLALAIRLADHLDNL